jgi:serine/threonine-protein kinase
MARVPRSIGPYDIDDVLGRGGMGEVLRAKHSLLQRPTALKRLAPPGELSDKERADWTERFSREGRALAKLRHENVVAIYDLFEHRKELWMALELVDGFSIADLVRPEGMPPDVACLIALGAARALDAAHRSGILHRDIKPANVMVSRAGVVKLMDFGVARDEALPALTETGAVVGTPTYLPPEVVKGAAPDERSDIYALGATLYEMLSGQKLFGHANADNVWALIANGKFQRLGKVAPHLPWRLVLVVERCLKTDPARRPQSAGELCAALERIVVDAGLSAKTEARLAGWLVSTGKLGEAEAQQALGPTEAFMLVELPLRARRPPWQRAALAGWAAATLLVIGFAAHPPAAERVREVAASAYAAVFAKRDVEAKPEPIPQIDTKPATIEAKPTKPSRR